ncbi:hypothetical protein GM3709_2839 [Geminocystis sp. NIES-3709]|nr:hypothetical protein GM3709_2839 [Geminocystis sp. NIES-3709]
MVRNPNYFHSKLDRCLLISLFCILLSDKRKNKLIINC